MSLWELLLYLAASFLAIRSLVMLMVDYKSRYRRRLQREQAAQAATQHADAENASAPSTTAETPAGDVAA